MASGLSSVVIMLALCVVFAPSVSAGDRDCQAYRDQPSQKCRVGFCCGTCSNRYCCQDSFWRFSEDKQDDCDYSFKAYSSPLPMVLGIGGFITVLLTFICCCVCPCCCLYKMCRSPRPVVATTHHTTVVTTAPQPQYPPQPAAAPGHPQSYQGGQYHPYHPVPVQSGYGAQPMPQAYGTQPMPTLPYHGQQVTAGPPPTYQEATGPGYPPSVMPYSQAAFAPGQPAYPLQPPAQPQPNAPAPAPAPAPSPYTDYFAQPAYNPDYTG